MPKRFVVEIELEEHESTVDTVKNLSAYLFDCFIPDDPFLQPLQPDFRYRIKAADAADWSTWTKIT